MRPKYKCDKNCQSGSSSEKENPDPKRQMIHEANEAPSTEVVKEFRPGCDQYEAESQECFKSSKLQVPVQLKIQLKVQMKVPMKVQMKIQMKVQKNIQF